MNRTLTLRREMLSDLTADDLAGVAGGQYTGPNGVSCAATDCVRMILTPVDLTRACPVSLDPAHCPTLAC